MERGALLRPKSPGGKEGPRTVTYYHLLSYYRLVDSWEVRVGKENPSEGTTGEVKAQKTTQSDRRCAEDGRDMGGGELRKTGLKG